MMPTTARGQWHSEPEIIVDGYSFKADGFASAQLQYQATET